MSYAARTHAYAHDAHLLVGLTMQMPSLLPTTNMLVKAFDDDNAMTMSISIKLCCGETWRLRRAVQTPGAQCTQEAVSIRSWLFLTCRFDVCDGGKAASAYLEQHACPALPEAGLEGADLEKQDSPQHTNEVLHSMLF